MHSSTYCWNRSGARQPFNHVLPRSSRYPITLKRRYVWRTQQPVSQLHTSKISTAQKIVSKYRLRRNLSYNRVAKPYAARVPSCFVGGPAGRHRASRSKLGGLITSRYVFRRNIACSRYKFRLHGYKLPKSPAIIRLYWQRQRSCTSASLQAANKLLKTTKANVWRLKNRHTLKRRKECWFFNIYGRCTRGESCPYEHNPDKVCVCTKFLHGKCQNETCKFRHVYRKNQMPECQLYQMGKCEYVMCPYSHTVGADAAAKDQESSHHKVKQNVKSVATSSDFSLTCRRTESSRGSVVVSSKKRISPSLKRNIVRFHLVQRAKFKKRRRIQKKESPEARDSIAALNFIPVPDVHNNESDIGPEILLADRRVVISDLIPPIVPLEEDIRILVQQSIDRLNKNLH